MLDKEILRKLYWNTNWDGTCGTCGNSARWCPKYGNMDNMRKTYCRSILVNPPYSENLVNKKSKPKWCPRMKELKRLGLI